MDFDFECWRLMRGAERTEADRNEVPQAKCSEREASSRKKRHAEYKSKILALNKETDKLGICIFLFSYQIPQTVSVISVSLMFSFVLCCALHNIKIFIKKDLC